MAFQRIRGFTLTELAVVFAIVGILLASLLLPLGTQVEQRQVADTTRRLEDAREALIGFAIVNGRLPCPARFAGLANNSAGRESFCLAATGTCPGTETTTVQAHGNCSNYFDGFVPAVAMGMQPIDPQGFAVDAWGNRIRYSVSSTIWGPPPPPPPSARFTKQHISSDPTAAWTVGTTPNDLVVCSASPAIITNTVCDANTSVTNQNTLVAIVFSTGKNSATGGTGMNEARNLDANALFVSRPPDPATAAGGEFDDVLVWLPVGILYSRMISAGVLP